jgi:hypothetical protein
MELTNAFRVSIPPADAWKVLTDAERIAPMLPGAQLQEIEGDELRGIIKVKVGPITAQYKGTASWVERDEAAGRAVLKASGRDTRGQGNASATITATLTPDGDATKVEVVTDLTITGKVAQFGRGVLADVSGKLIGQFVDALEADLRGERTGPAAPSTPASGPTDREAASGGSQDAAGTSTPAPAEAPGVEQETGPAAEKDATATSAGEGAAPSAPSGPRRIEHPEPEPVDLLDAAGGSVAKRLAPVLGGLGAIALVLVVLRRLVRR